jgi:hypothetical protein
VVAVVDAVVAALVVAVMVVAGAMVAIATPIFSANTLTMQDTVAMVAMALRHGRSAKCASRKDIRRIGVGIAMKKTMFMKRRTLVQQ